MIRSLFHWKVLLNLLLAAGIFTGLVWLTFRWLEYHTTHGKEIPVPNVMNMSVQNAIKYLDDAGLEYEVDSLAFDPKFKPFQVLKVYPAPGARVKGGRTITLLVNPKYYAPVQVPDVLDRYKGLAFSQLERVGLKVGDTIYEPSIQRDAVLRMLYNKTEIKPGALLPRFSSIDLVIGSGPKRNIPVPNVVGLSVAEAKRVISAQLFEVGIVDFEDGKNDESDIVYYQDPPTNALRDQGMQIDLWASKKTPAELGAKISYLNSIYSVKIDTTLPPIRYEEVIVPEYKEIPVEAPPVSKPQVSPSSPATSTQSKTEAKPSSPATKPKVDAKTANTASTSSTSKKGSAATPAEKPKAKKVVVE